jgi:DNA-directed RNA polymerase I subunit RPA2
MVNDKFQVRTTGPVDKVTHQPIKGRKRAGGIRFGVMERDSLLAHGVSFLLQDRLMNCSDYSQAHVCTKCGSILSPHKTPEGVKCIICNGDHIEVIAVPYVFRYLCTELVAMNVKLTLKIE